MYYLTLMVLVWNIDIYQYELFLVFTMMEKSTKVRQYISRGIWASNPQFDLALML